jgi:hypothetical protein
MYDQMEAENRKLQRRLMAGMYDQMEVEPRMQQPTPTAPHRVRFHELVENRMLAVTDAGSAPQSWR